MTSFNYRMMDEPLRQMFPNGSDILANSATAESVRANEPVIESAAGQDGAGGLTFPSSASSASSAYSGPSGQSLLSMLAQQEPRHGDTASSVSDLNFRMGSMDLNFETASGYYPSNARAEQETSRGAPAWSSEGAANSRVQDQMNSFEFLVKSVFAANNFVSTLTREQLSMLQALRPSLLYQFLQDIARARSDKRTPRWVTHQDCAFCKNNGESEECYSSHSLKDWRGRVRCPVLRAFRCPRCGATGDHAHTIKYCQQNHNADHERSGGLASRRRGPSTPLLAENLSGEMLTHLGPLTPNPTPSPASVSVNTPMTNSNVWSSF